MFESMFKCVVIPRMSDSANGRITSSSFAMVRVFSNVTNPVNAPINERLTPNSRKSLPKIEISPIFRMFFAVAIIPKTDQAKKIAINSMRINLKVGCAQN